MMATHIHFQSAMTREAFLFLLLCSLMIWLMPQSAFSASVENGKTIYKQKCISCHTIGGGKLAGPDLIGVTSQRDESWLIRWIVEPDKMLAEGDALALELKKEYNNIPMPNLMVSNAQAKDILAYIAAETATGGSSAKAQPKQEPKLSLSDIEKSLIEGKEIYQANCAACHTIGEGSKRAGPNLKGVNTRREAEWLKRWIMEPDIMLAEGDPIALELKEKYNNIPMPNFGITEEQAENVLAYIAFESGEEAFPQPEPAQSEAMTQAAAAKVEGDQAIGRALFTGEQSLANGGTHCISCHTTSDMGGLGGGSLGPDLTKLYSRYGGEMGLVPVLLSLPFPTMQGIFSKHPLIESEAAHLTAYFAQTDKLEEKPSMDYVISGISVFGFIILYILIHLIWRKRLTGVRKPLVGR
jgi:mono/diheme cytochrome c family protein